MRSRLANNAVLQEVAVGGMRISVATQTVNETENLHAVGVLDSRKSMRNGDRSATFGSDV